MPRKTATATKLESTQKDSQLDSLESSITCSRNWFLAEQKPEGFWQAPLEANVGMDAQYIIFNRFMGRRSERLEARVVEHMLAKQSADGSWPLFAGGPGHLNTTIESFFALKLSGRSGDDEPLRRAKDFIKVNGGLARAGIFTRTFLYYFGQFPEWGLPAMPVEVNLLPPWFPINIYALSSWARGTVVPLTVLMAKAPRIQIDPEQGVAELWNSPPTPADLAFPSGKKLLSWANFFLGVDAALKFVGRSSWKPLRERAMRRAEKWILDRQDSNGGWGGIQPAMINSVMALRVLGYPDSHPAVAKGIEAIDDFLIEDEGHLLFQPCVSPTWDTAWAAMALLDSGLDPADEALKRAARWLIDRQIFKPGDWSSYNPKLEPGGWAFEFANDWYPDTDDSAVILMILKRIAGVEGPALDRSIAYGLNWVLGMQSTNGGWAAFDTNNDSEFLNRIPFADMEAMIDPPTEDLTGRLLEMMGAYGYDLRFERARRAYDFVRQTQRNDGSWWGRWGSNFVYGTWSVLAGLRGIGDDMSAPHVRSAVRWLESRQNADGGWGESLVSYADESQAGRGESSPSQTAWGLLGLLAAEEGVTESMRRGAEFLMRTQLRDGSWREDQFTGTGFPRHFYLRYRMYKDYFPLSALSRVRNRIVANHRN